MTCKPVIENESIGLLAVVKALGEYLTSPKEELRVRGQPLLFLSLSFLVLEVERCILQPSDFSLESLPSYLPPKSTDSPVRISPSSQICGPSTGSAKSTHLFTLARVLTSFYCDKLDDIYVTFPALQGICVLSSLPTFGSGETVLVCEAYVP